jgi:hypothetical protein
MSLGYNILTAITWLQANINIRLLHDATTPSCSELGGCATLPQHVQHWVAASSPAWLDSIVASITWHHCRQHDSTSTSRRGQVASVASSTAWLNNTVASMTHHLHRISAVPSPAWLGIYIAPRLSYLSSTVASMTRCNTLIFIRI